MSRKIRIRTVRLYQVVEVDDETEAETVVFETLDGEEANNKAGFFRENYALSDCVNYDTNSQGDCGGRVENVNGTVICETCRNK